MNYKKSIKELLCILKAGTEYFGGAVGIIALIKSKVIDWIQSQHRFLWDFYLLFGSGKVELSNFFIFFVTVKSAVDLLHTVSSPPLNH